VRRYWTNREVAELRQLYPDTGNKEIGARFGRAPKAIALMALKLGLRKSALHIAEHCRYRPGHATWNKGKAWSPAGSKATQFKKGHRGGRYRRVGSKRRDRDGVYVKVASPNVWRPLARVVWEKNFGPIPEGMLVRVTDENCAPENLRLIDRREHMRLNWRPRGPVKRDLRWLAPLRKAA
jgi:hypothetical protein